MENLTTEQNEEQSMPLLNGEDKALIAILNKIKELKNKQDNFNKYLNKKDE
jgi:hypothetical protein